MIKYLTLFLLTVILLIPSNYKAGNDITYGNHIILKPYNVMADASTRIISVMADSINIKLPIDVDHQQDIISAIKSNIVLSTFTAIIWSVSIFAVLCNPISKTIFKFWNIVLLVIMSIISMIFSTLLILLTYRAIINNNTKKH